MQVRVVHEGLTPCMQHGDETYLGAEVFRISSDFLECFASRRKEQIVDGSFVVQRQWSE